MLVETKKAKNHIKRVEVPDNPNVAETVTLVSIKNCGYEAVMHQIRRGLGGNIRWILFHFHQFRRFFK